MKASEDVRWLDLGLQSVGRIGAGVWGNRVVWEGKMCGRKLGGLLGEA
jgi:hypothetical protein